MNKKLLRRFAPQEKVSQALLLPPFVVKLADLTPIDFDGYSNRPTTLTFLTCYPGCQYLTTETNEELRFLPFLPGDTNTWCMQALLKIIRLLLCM